MSPMYGYKTNKEFIDKSYQLLEKLEKKGIWNKDTLVIGLDKSVRPLAHTLRKLAKEEGKSSPDIRFFNYSHIDYNTNDYFQSRKNFEKLSDYIKTKIDPKEFSKYKKFLILDDFAYSGQSLLETGEILSNLLKESKNDSQRLYFAALKVTDNTRQFDGLISIDKGGQIKNNSYDTGIWEDIEYPLNKEGEKVQVHKSKRIDEEGYRTYSFYRTKLNKDIKKYAKKNKLGRTKEPKQNLLEKIVRFFSFIFLVSGFVLGFDGITGNIVGTSSSSNVLGIILILLGIFGLLFSKRFKK